MALTGIRLQVVGAVVQLVASQAIAVQLIFCTTDGHHHIVQSIHAQVPIGHTLHYFVCFRSACAVETIAFIAVYIKPGFVLGLATSKLGSISLVLP